MPNIFSPLRIRNTAFLNRAVMAPMVCFQWQTEDGVMRDKLLEHYLHHGSRGLGLLILQALLVGGAERAKGRAGAYADGHIPYLRHLAENSRAHGTRLFAQLAYPFAGRQDATERAWFDNLSEAELWSIGASFVAAALRCKEAGLDGVELHGAHGYFLNMLADPLSNTRRDNYGGDREGRLTFVREIIAEIRRQAGEDFLISYRFGISHDEAADALTARALAFCGLDAIHVSFGIPQRAAPRVPKGFPCSPTAFAAGRLRRELSIPVIAVNSIASFENGSYLIENGYCDFAAYGRPFLADPDFFEKSVRDPGHEPCLNCEQCDWFNRGRKCPGRKKLRPK